MSREAWEPLPQGLPHKMGLSRGTHTLVVTPDVSKDAAGIYPVISCEGTLLVGESLSLPLKVRQDRGLALVRRLPQRWVL